MPKGKFVKVVIPLYYEGHVYRAGTPDPDHDRRTERHPADLVVPAPAPGKGTSQVSIAFSKSRPSSLFLPVVPGVSVPTGLPAVRQPAQRAVPPLREDGEPEVGLPTSHTRRRRTQ